MDDDGAAESGGGAHFAQAAAAFPTPRCKLELLYLLPLRLAMPPCLNTLPPVLGALHERASYVKLSHLPTLSH